MPDADLLDGLEKLLEKIAVAIHVSGEGSVDLQEFVRRWGSAAQLLWHASQLDQAAPLPESCFSEHLFSQRS